MTITIHPGIYRSNPLTVEAMRLDSSNGRQVSEWCAGSYSDETVILPTLRGVTTAYAGDWIVHTTSGHYVVMPDGEFAATYSRPTAY